MSDVKPVGEPIFHGTYDLFAERRLRPPGWRNDTPIVVYLAPTSDTAITTERD